MRILTANVAVALLGWGWWSYCGGNRSTFLAGLLLAAAALAIGLALGVWCNQPSKRASRGGRRIPIVPRVGPADASAFDTLTE